MFGMVDLFAAEHPAPAMVRWPALRYEELPWQGVGPWSRPDTYRACVPAKIANRPVNLPSDLVVESEKAMAAMVRFDAEASSRLPMFVPTEEQEAAPLASLLLRTESTASSRIENVVATAAQVAAIEVDGDLGASVAATLIANHVDAMRRAFESHGEIDLDAILSVHKMLMQGEEFAGKLRKTQVWIGGGNLSPRNAVFVPPKYQRVREALKDLIRFIARTDIPVLVQAAIAHAQFETIHPFVDGNGRTGRAIPHMLMRARGLTQRMTVPVSAGLVLETEGYIAALELYRRGDARPIIHRFNRAAEIAVENGRVLVDDLVEIRQRWANDVVAHRHSSAWNALDLVMRYPVVSRGVLSRTLGVSIPTATAAINTLRQAQVLTPLSSTGREELFCSLEILEALDDFTARSRRGAGRTFSW